MRFLLLSGALLVSVHLIGQTYEMLEWGEVPSEQLAMTSYNLDSTAQAVVLADQGVTDVRSLDDGTYSAVTYRHRRVKILSEAAIDKYGNAAIYYYHEGGTDHLRRVNAQTIAPDGTITKVGKKEIFHEKINEYWSKATFGFQQVEVGSVVEYSYQLYSKRLLAPDEWAFREEIPVQSSYYKFTCSVPLAYTYLLRGAEYMDRQVTPDKKERITLGDMTILVDGTEFWMQNGQALQDEPYITTLEDYFVKVRFQCSEQYHRDGTKNSVFGTWEKTCQELLDDNNLGHYFTKPRHSKRLVEVADLAIDASLPQQEVLANIQSFVTQEITWDGTLGKYADKTPDKAYETHTGSTAEVQYAGIALLRHFGFKAYPLLVSTRDNGAVITAFPFLRQFNYVIILVETDKGLKLMDMTNPLYKPGIIRQRALNRVGFLLKAENPTFIDLQLPVFQDRYAFNGTVQEDGTVAVEMRSVQRAYSALADRTTLNKEAGAVESIWSDRLPTGTAIATINLENEGDVQQPLKVNTTFTVEGAAFVNDDLMYLSPILYSEFAENPLVSEQRTFPIDFTYPFEEKLIYSYQIPEGYTTESLPEAAKISLPDGDATYQYQVREASGKISIISVLKVKKRFYLPTEYAALRTLFATAAQKMQEQIVFRKNS